MFVLINLAWFFIVYLPLTALAGLLAGSFRAPGMARDLAYELFLWFVVAVQLLVPTLAVFLIVLLLQYLIGRTIGNSGRLVAVLATGSLLPLSQALVWGGNGVSVHWVVVAVVPAVVLGAVSRLPDAGR